MLKRILLLTNLVFCAGVLVSCGGGGGGSAAITMSTSLDDSDVRGRWVRPCDGSSGASSLTDTIEFFADGTFNRRGTAFFDLACFDIGFDIETSGSVAEGDSFEVAGRGIATPFDTTTMSYVVTPRSETAVLFFNSETTCGISDWAIGDSRDISDCPNRPGEVNARPLPFSDFSIYLVDRGQLFFGTEQSLTAENRPMALATFPTYVRDTGAEGDEFPGQLLGLWELISAEGFVELSTQGLIRFYNITPDGCYVFNFLSLFSQGDDNYRDPFNFFFLTITLAEGNLNLAFTGNPQASVYQPAGITAQDLPVCVF